MIPQFSENDWENELEKLKLSPLTREKLSAAIRAFQKRHKSPVVTEDEFNQIVDQVFFFTLGKKRLLLNRNKSGTLTLVSQK